MDRVTSATILPSRNRHLYVQTEYLRLREIILKIPFIVLFSVPSLKSWDKASQKFKLAL